MELLDNNRGNYRYLTGIPPFSSGVIAMPGHEVVFATLLRPVPWRDGFAMIDAHLSAADRPRQALCAIALRSPAPMSPDGFDDFNAGYRALLDEWQILLDGENPVARTNVAPVVSAPAEPSLYAFAYTRPTTADRTTFVVAGAGDVKRQSLDQLAVVRAGESSAEAMAEKAAHVMSVMQKRLHTMGADWDLITAVNVYTPHILQPYLADTLLTPAGPAAIHGVHWHLANPPIEGLAFEMDMRGVVCELSV